MFHPLVRETHCGTPLRLKVNEICSVCSVRVATLALLAQTSLQRSNFLMRVLPRSVVMGLTNGALRYRPPP